MLYLSNAPLIDHIFFFLEMWAELVGKHKESTCVYGYNRHIQGPSRTLNLWWASPPDCPPKVESGQGRNISTCFYYFLLPPMLDMPSVFGWVLVRVQTFCLIHFVSNSSIKPFSWKFNIFIEIFDVHGLFCRRPIPKPDRPKSSPTVTRLQSRAAS